MFWYFQVFEGSLELVLKRIEKVGLKLKPAKCKFVCQEEEYLHHLVIPGDYKQIYEHLISAVKEFQPYCNCICQSLTKCCQTQLQYMFKLETVTVAWVISHFHTYLYGQQVTVLVDYATVKPILEFPNPSGKHARWWTKVFGFGIKQANQLSYLNAILDQKTVSIWILLVTRLVTLTWIQV